MAVPNRALVRLGAAAASTAVGALAGSTAGAAYLARTVLTPDLRRPDDLEILEVHGDRITITRNEETDAPGTYGIWINQRRGHFRVGEVLEQTPDTVTRRFLGLDSGTLAPGPGRWNMYAFTGRPSDSVGLPDEEILVPSDIGDMPAWLVPGDQRGTLAAQDVWAIHVHGRGATRDEALRALPVLHGMGVTSLVPTYRNDAEAPAGPDGRYNLGLSEWRDIDAAMAEAVRRGARHLVLLGWSMGGAIVLQTLDLSSRADLVAAVVLDSPVIDWGDVIMHHARLNRAPMWLARSATRLMGSRRSRLLVGVHEPVDVARTDWVARAADLRHELLVLHSADDEFVPYGPSVALAKARPDLVRLELFDHARHCKQWNVDPQRWETLVGEHVLRGVRHATSVSAESR